MIAAVSVNYWAVLVAAIAAHAVGFLWYGPLFGKIWMRLMNIDKKKMDEAKKKGMGPTYLIMAITTLLTSYVLAHFVKYLNATDIGGALQAAIWIWLGFIATIQTGIVLWEGKPWKLYFLNAAHWLVSLAVMATILALWP